MTSPLPRESETDVWEVERDRHGVMFSGPLEVGECRRVVDYDILAEVGMQRDMAEAYMNTLHQALELAIHRGKFDVADALKLKAALREGSPVDA